MMLLARVDCMTSINKLTVNPILYGDDKFPIWDSRNGRTRSVTADTVKKFITQEGFDPDAFVAGRIEDNKLIMVTLDGTDKVIGDVLSEYDPNSVVNGKIENEKLVLITLDGNEIDLGLIYDISDHDIQELKNVGELEAGKFLAVDDAGQNVVYRSADPGVSDVVIENNGEIQGQAANLDYGRGIFATVPPTRSGTATFYAINEGVDITDTALTLTVDDASKSYTVKELSSTPETVLTLPELSTLFDGWSITAGCDNALAGVYRVTKADSAFVVAEITGNDIKRIYVKDADFHVETLRSLQPILLRSVNTGSDKWLNLNENDYGGLPSGEYIIEGKYSEFSNLPVDFVVNPDSRVKCQMYVNNLNDFLNPMYVYSATMYIYTNAEGNDSGFLVSRAGETFAAALQSGWQNVSMYVENNGVTIGSPTYLNFSDGLDAQISGNKITVANKANALYFDDTAFLRAIVDGVILTTTNADRIAAFYLSNPGFTKGSSIILENDETTTFKVSNNSITAISIAKNGVVTFPQNTRSAPVFLTTQDVASENSKTLSSDAAGQTINLTQSSGPKTLMTFTLDGHDQFQTGDIIKIVADDQYLNDFFTVNYYDAAGVLHIKHPSNSFTMIRNDVDWNVEEDGLFTSVYLATPSQTVFSPVQEDAYAVNGFAFVQRPGISIVEDDSGKSVVRVDVGNAGGGGNTNLNYTELAGEYDDFHDPKWGELISSFEDNQDIAYFIQAGHGAQYQNLPASIELDDDVFYRMITQISTAPSKIGFFQFTTITSEADTVNNNKMIVRCGVTFDDCKDKWTEYAIINSENETILNKVAVKVFKVHLGPGDEDQNFFTDVYIDGNKNTTFRAIGDTHYYRKDPQSNDLTEIYQIDNANRFIVKTKIKSPVITNLSNGTTNSNSTGAAFFDLSTSDTVKIGAYDKVTITVSGEKVTFGGGTMTFDDTGEGFIRNLGLISRNSSNETNSIKLNDGNITHTTDIHSFKLPSGTELINFNKDFINFKNHNIKFVRHLVGNTPGTMFVANVNIIKRDDAENNKNSITLNDGSIIAATNKFEVKNNDGARRFTVENDGISVHERKIQELADGEEPTDAATVGQLDAATGIPYLRKFDSTGGDIRAQNYPEGRVQAWINYKGDGVSEVSIDSMRNNSDQQYDQIALDNQSQNVCKLRLFFNGASVLRRVLPGEIIQCWASREFTRWKWVYGTEESPTGAFNLKSGYSKVTSGGGSTHKIEYWENGSILSISNPKVEVRLLEGMNEEENKHGYVKYINTRNDDVEFTWFDRNGNQTTGHSVPATCPANTVVEIFADYAKDQYFLTFGQSKVINTLSEDDQLVEGLASGFLYAKNVTVG